MQRQLVSLTRFVHRPRFGPVMVRVWARDHTLCAGTVTRRPMHGRCSHPMPVFLSSWCRYVERRLLQEAHAGLQAQHAALQARLRKQETLAAAAGGP